MNSDKTEKVKADVFSMFECGPECKDFSKESSGYSSNDYTALLYLVD